MKAYKAAKEAADGGQAVSAALQLATSVPLGVAEKAVEVMGIARTLQPISNPNMKSDLLAAIALATAALEGALANVAINLDSLDATVAENAEFLRTIRARVAALQA